MHKTLKYSAAIILIILVSCQSSKVSFLGVESSTNNTTDNVESADNNEQNNLDKKQKTPKLKKSFENGEYNQAINEYKDELEDDENSPTANYYIAESYRLSNRIYLAAPYYQKTIALGFNDEALELHYAKSLKANGQYTEAKSTLQSFLESGTNETLLTRAEKELKNLEKLDSLQLVVKQIKVQNASAINTENAEYSPYFHDGHLYFSSTRETGNVFEGNGLAFSDLFKVKTNGLDIDAGSLESLESFINEQGIHEGTIAFSPDGRTMVFARGNSSKKGGRQDVDLFISQLKNKKWSQPQLMPINSPDSWDSSPAFSRNGRTLYFASDRPGGEGGIDIYRARLNDRGRWGNVSNMGSTINTAENEMFPYVSPDNKLYFASDGHPGFGMLDLFVAVRSSGVTTIQNLGPSVNSNFDDFGLVYTEHPYEGFFASNRPGGMGDDDIYSLVDNSPELKKIEYVLKGNTYTTDEDSVQSILSGVRVRLMNAELEQIDDVVTGRGGTFSFKVDPEKEYVLIGEKTDFFTTRGDFSTVGKGIPQEDLVERFTKKEFETSLNLDPILLEKTIVLENIYYDLNKSEIRPDAASELDKLVQLLKDNPEIKIELSSHTDVRADDDFNMRLSQARAKAAVDYMIFKGIDPRRLTAKGYGESQLIIPHAQTEEEHQKNRRTEFKVIEYNKSGQ